MNLYLFLNFVFFLCILIKFTAVISNPTHLTGDVSINCGSKGNSAATNGREWIGDIQPKSSPLLQMSGSSTTSTVIRNLIASDRVPHKTARFSRTRFSYAIQVSPGQKILRLHFNPTSYKGFNEFNDLFTVEAGPFTLLGNFSASLTAGALVVDSFVKEFCLNIQENQHLNIFFSPDVSYSLDTYAFINGIEIISVPASLSYFEGGDVGLERLGKKYPVYIDSSTALEIIHQVEIKKNNVRSSGDSDGTFPKWVNRNPKTRNDNTWKMPVDVGFKYLIRVHFSELGLKVGDNKFKVLINEMIARINFDGVKERDENSMPWHRDYMVMVSGNKKEGKRDILISLQSHDELIDDRVLLSGFEIFKLSNYDNSLAGPNPLPLAQDSPSHHTVQTLFRALFQRYGVANVVIAIIYFSCIIVHKWRQIREAIIAEEENKPKPELKPSLSARAERICRRFSLDEIQLATDNFNEERVIGNGGFGKVYKGRVDNEQTTFAIKRLESTSTQGEREFLAEIETLSELRHRNLVPLIGYSNEQEEMILVYEFMPRGTLADHIYKLAREDYMCSSLTWKQRLDICIGAGRGLDYLHTGHGIIHRDVKATNILLDENLIARVSDFGLAKPENGSGLQSHVTTKVAGTFGYIDPSYSRTGRLTTKSDTYSFGVVLLEVLCGRPAAESIDVDKERILSMWAQDKINKGEVDQIVASSLREEISPTSLKKFVDVAQRCLHEEPDKRPTMSQVVSQLELAVEQQENKQPLETVEIVQTRQPTVFSAVVQNFSPPLQEQTNSNVVIDQLPLQENELPPLSGASSSAISESRSTSDSCRRFSLEEIKAATRNFDDDSIIKCGSSFNVYKGFINDDSATTVAIKIPKLRSFPSARVDEIDMASKLRHLHVLSPIGYCNEGGEMKLVYDYMARGCLRDHLNNSTKYPPLNWTQRLQICIGVARGSLYINTDIEHHNMFGNIGAKKILLDEKWVAKVSAVRTDKWRELRMAKYDVYSLGLVLLEVLFTKPGQPLDKRGSAESCLTGTFIQHIDPNLFSQITPQCLSKFVETTVACVNENPSKLPAMSDVLRDLELAMQLQEAPEQPAEQRGGRRWWGLF
ncbi:hypothetical protein ABFS83_08G032400 [Erythranthe nasuta]